MPYENGEVKPQSADEWLDDLLTSASEHFGDDLPGRENSGVASFYTAFAEVAAELEQELESVQDSVRVLTATGENLDILGQELNVSRRPETSATGEVTFSRSNAASSDYLVPDGTRVQTSSSDPVKFETTEQVTLSSGSTSVTAPIEAVNPGPKGNVAAGTITDAVQRPAGVETVSNASKTGGGRSKETDEAYRDRIIEIVGNTESTSGYNLYRRLSSYEYVREVRFIDNSADVQQDQLSPNEIEVVVSATPGHKDEIAQVIFEEIPGGSNLVSGVHGISTSGTAGLPNGQQFTISFSEPTPVEIYVDVSVESEKALDESNLKDQIVEYIGGTLSSGSLVYGELGVAEDVLIGEVEYQIRDIPGVYDVTNLTIGTADSPTGTSNVSISTSEIAQTAESNIGITTSSI